MLDTNQIHQTRSLSSRSIHSNKRGELQTKKKLTYFILGSGKSESDGELGKELRVLLYRVMYQSGYPGLGWNNKQSPEILVVCNKNLFLVDAT